MHPPVDGPAADEMREFFGRYGSFLQLWQTYELMLEVMIMRTLRLSEVETSIVCGSLTYAAKSNILLALLNLNQANSAAVTAIRAAQAAAERNDFVHSFITHAGSFGLMRLVRREVKNGKYKVDSREVGKVSMQNHGDNFARAFQKACAVVSISDDDVDAYTRAIEGHEQGHQ
jgi:hypothetical protein